MISENSYFEGKVKSLGAELQGRRFTSGIIDTGEFTFGTQTEERMEITHGEMEVIHPDGKQGRYRKGDAFSVPANAKFTVKVKAPVAYVCHYK